MGKNHLCNEGLVACPYFLCETGTTITCEGLENKTKVITKFQTKPEKRTFMRTRCFSIDTPCKLGAMLNDKLCQ